MFKSKKFLAGFLFISVFISSCHNYGTFVKLFHIRGQHYVPTYAVDKSPEKLKAEFKKYFSAHPELLLTDGQTNNYVEGKYFAEIKDSVSKKSFMIRFGLYEETSAKDSSYSFIKIYSRKDPESAEWSAFFSNKTSRRELQKIDLLTRKYLFSKITGAKFVMVSNTSNGYTVFEKKK